MLFACRNWQGINQLPCSREKSFWLNLLPQAPLLPGLGKGENSFLFSLCSKGCPPRSRGKDYGEALRGIPPLTLRQDRSKTHPSWLGFSQPCPLLCPPRLPLPPAVPLAAKANGLDETKRHQVPFFAHSLGDHMHQETQAPPVSLWRNSRYSKLDNGEFHKGHFFKGILCRVASIPTGSDILGTPMEIPQVRGALGPSGN